VVQEQLFVYLAAKRIPMKTAKIRPKTANALIINFLLETSLPATAALEMDF
jgi:hypothetical protein